MPGSNPAERAAVYDAMNATIARLHAFDPAKIGLGDFGKGENYVARQVDRWSKQYRASQTETIEAMERLIEWLPTHIPPADGPTAGAWRLPARQSDRRARAAENRRRARLGIVDARRSARRFHLSPDGLAHAAFRRARPAPPRWSGTISPRSAFRRWRIMSTLTLRAPGSIRAPRLPVYLAYNFFRIAAILQGIIGRVRDGTATSEFAPAKAEMIRPLADKAWEFAQRANRPPHRAYYGQQILSPHRRISALSRRAKLRPARYHGAAQSRKYHS